MRQWLCLIACLCACVAPQRPPPPVAMPPDGLVNMAEIPWNFEWRQTIKAEYTNQAGGRETKSVEAVLQKQGNVLTMVGLTPLGTRAFVAKQEGITVTAESADAKALPFPPALVFLDVNRCLFVGITPTTPPDGWHAHHSHGVDIKDLWKGGLLVQRELFDASLKTKLSIGYTPGYKAGAAPSTLTLTNERFAYRLTITTLESSAL